MEEVFNKMKQLLEQEIKEFRLKTLQYYHNEEGGGIFLGQNGKVSLVNCTIENCRASGGINTRNWINI